MSTRSVPCAVGPLSRRALPANHRHLVLSAARRHPTFPANRGFLDATRPPRVGRAARCARGRRPARSPSAPRAPLGASSRSPARPRHRPQAPQPGPATAHRHRSHTKPPPADTTAAPSNHSRASCHVRAGIAYEVCWILAETTPHDEAPVHETNDTTIDTSTLKPETTGTSVCASSLKAETTAATIDASLPRDATVGTTVDAPQHQIETTAATVDTSSSKAETTGTSVCASSPRDATVGTTVDAPQHQIETTAATVNDVRPFLGCFSPIEVPPVSYRRFNAPTEAPRVSFNRPQLLAKVSSVPPRTREFHRGPNSSATGPRNLRADTCSFTTKCTKRPT